VSAYDDYLAEWMKRPHAEFLARWVGVWVKPVGYLGEPWRIKRAWFAPGPDLRVVGENSAGEREFSADECEFRRPDSTGWFSGWINGPR
jgi:hypothetical protein